MPTQKQIDTLKRLVMLARCFPASPMAEDRTQRTLAQKIVLFLIEHSDQLTKDICITLQESQRGYSSADIGEAVNEIRFMCHETGTVHLHELFSLTGSVLRISHSYGDFDPNRRGPKLDNAGQFEHMEPPPGNTEALHEKGLPFRFTFWLSREGLSEEATLIPVTKRELNKIHISREAADALLRE